MRTDNSDNDILYIALILDDESKNMLLSSLPTSCEGWKKFAHHMTIAFRTQIDDGVMRWFNENNGRKYTLTSRLIGKSDKAIAVMVNTECPSKNRIKHVTIAVNEENGGKPYDSNLIEKWYNTKPITLNGTVMAVRKKTTNLSESKMRGWKYADDVNRICHEIIANKEQILSKDGWTCMYLDKFRVYVASHNVFARTYPEYKNAGGFMTEGCIIFYIKEWYTEKTVKEIIQHELEHAIDYEPETKGIFSGKKQQDIQTIAYSGVYQPKKYSGDDSVTLENFVKEILYKYWISTERNAFISQMVQLSNEEINSMFESARYMLEWIEGTDTKEHADLWMKLKPLLDNRIHAQKSENASTESIKKHFIRQSYENIRNYEKTVWKKIRYAKENGLMQNIQA